MAVEKAMYDRDSRSLSLSSGRSAFIFHLSSNFQPAANLGHARQGNQLIFANLIPGIDLCMSGLRGISKFALVVEWPCLSAGSITSLTSPEFASDPMEMLHLADLRIPRDQNRKVRRGDGRRAVNFGSWLALHAVEQVQDEG